MDQSKLLKLKGKFYQYTGIYLATNEQLEYITSDAFWKEFERMEPFNYDNDFTNQDLQGLLIGSWQAQYGFYRRMSRRFDLKSLYNPWYINVLSWIDVFVLRLVDDVKYLLQNKIK